MTDQDESIPELDDLPWPEDDYEFLAFGTVAVHEAGHAVAMALAGIRVKSVWASLDYEVEEGRGRTRFESYPLEGDQAPWREAIICLAGPAAQYRIQPSVVRAGMTKDKVDAAHLLRHANRTLGQACTLQLAWVEACRMMHDEHVWDVVTEIAMALLRNRTRRMRGSRVHRIVEQRLPSGWDWTPAPLPTG